MYLVLPTNDTPPLMRDYLATMLVARATMLRRAATLAEDEHEPHDALDTIAQTVQPLNAAATQLDATAANFTTLDEYSAAWAAADALCRPVLAALARVLNQARGALLAGQLAPEAHAVIERRIARVLEVAGRLGGI